MTQKQLEEMFEAEKAKQLVFEGHCHDCDDKIQVIATMRDDGIQVTGGAVFKPGEDIFIKCEDCYKVDNTLTCWQPCQVYSRVVGFYRPVEYWNKGKREEFKMRKNFKTFSLDEKAESLIHCD